MPDQLQLRGGTTVQHSTFTGVSKEVTVDTTKKTAVVHDGSTVGGNPLLREDASNSALALASAGTPSLKFSGDSNTGVFSPGADQLAITTGGTSRLAVSTTAVSSTLPVDVPLGAVGTPSLTFTGDLNTGIYSPGADQVAISTNGTGKLFVDSIGNIGTGAASPSAWSYGGNITIPGAGRYIASTSDDIRFASNIYESDVTRYSANGFAARYRMADGTHQWSIAATGTAGNAITLNEAMRILATGNVAIDTNTLYVDAVNNRVGLGTSAPSYQLQVSTDSAGKPSTSTWTIVSDERIKEDIELADLDLCYEAIKAIPLKRYKWRDEIYTAEQVTDRRKLGWIAQDVETVFPKAVGTHEFKYNQVFEETIIPAVEEELDADGNVITPAQPERIEKGELISEDVIEDCRDLNADQLYAAMYGAVQKLMAKVETLEASNADLIARLSALEAA